MHLELTWSNKDNNCSWDLWSSKCWSGAIVWVSHDICFHSELYFCYRHGRNPSFLMASETAYRKGLANTLRVLLALWLQCLHIFLSFVHNINFQGVKDRKQMAVGISWLFPTCRMHPRETEWYQKVTRFPWKDSSCGKLTVSALVARAAFTTEGILPGIAETKPLKWLPGRAFLLFIMRVFLHPAWENMSMVFHKLSLKASVHVQGCF